MLLSSVWGRIQAIVRTVETTRLDPQSQMEPDTGNGPAIPRWVSWPLR